MVTSSVTGEIKRADTCRQQLAYRYGVPLPQRRWQPFSTVHHYRRLRFTQIPAISPPNERT